MVPLPTRYYVQKSQTDSTFSPPQGWETVLVTFDPELADRHAQDFQRAVLFEQGANVSELASSTVVRVVTHEELRAESEASLVRAEMETRSQFWEGLEQWAAPLVDPAHE